MRAVVNTNRPSCERVVRVVSDAWLPGAVRRADVGLAAALPRMVDGDAG